MCPRSNANPSGITNQEMTRAVLPLMMTTPNDEPAKVVALWWVRVRSYPDGIQVHQPQERAHLSSGLVSLTFPLHLTLQHQRLPVVTASVTKPTFTDEVGRVATGFRRSADILSLWTSSTNQVPITWLGAAHAPNGCARRPCMRWLASRT